MIDKRKEWLLQLSATQTWVHFVKAKASECLTLVWPYLDNSGLALPRYYLNDLRVTYWKLDGKHKKRIIGQK